MNIVKAEIEDSINIAKIIKSGWNSAYKGLIDDDFLINMNEEKMAEGWKDNIERNQNIYVYRKEKEILGIIKFGKAEDTSLVDTGEIYVLYVKPEEKRKGIGSKLLSFAKNELLKQGYKKMIVWCLKGNVQGSNFYKKMGGKYIGNRNYELKGLKVEEEGFLYNLSDHILLVRPTKEHKEELIKYKEEFFSNGEIIIHACSRWDKMDNYEEWLKDLESHAKFETITDNWTVHTNFLGVRESDNKIVGMIDIRHKLTNEFLRNYAGHIGYAVRPTERKKGYATQMLNQALDFCKNELKLDKVMISCAKENPGSRNTILKAGGILEKEYTAEDGENVQVYWIKL